MIIIQNVLIFNRETEFNYNTHFATFKKGQMTLKVTLFPQQTMPLKVLLFSLAVFIFSSFSNTIQAQTDTLQYQQLLKLESIIHQSPKVALEQLNSISSSIDKNDKLSLALFHLRKLQAENLLNHWDAFEITLKTGLQNLGPTSPVFLKSYYHSYQGISAVRQANYTIAKDHLQQAVKFAESTIHVNAHVFALEELAYAYSLEQNFEQALLLLHKAKSVALNEKNPFLLAIVEESYGATFSYMDNYQKSLEHYNSALVIYQQLELKPYQAEALLGMGMTYRHAQQWPQAISSLSAYVSLTENNPSEISTFYANYGLGMTYADQQLFQKAKPYLISALNSNGPNDYKAEIYKQLSLTYLSEGSLEKAFNSLQLAKNIFSSIPSLEHTSWSIETIQIESELYFASKQFEKSHTLLQEYHQLHIQILQNKSSERLLKLQIGMDNQRKDLQIEILKSKAASDLVQLAAQQKVQKNQQLLNSLFLFVLFGVLIFAYWQRRTSKKFRLLSNYDGLTGVYNRRFIFQQLGSLLENLPPRNGQLCLVLADIDDFKNTNDEYGHPSGDEVLKQTANIGLSILRPGDIIARIGGEEFMMLLPRTSASQGLNVANRWRKALQQIPIKDQKGNSISVSISVGVASFDKNCTTSDSLYSRADKALYKAKSLGKNQAIIWQQ